MKDDKLIVSRMETKPNRYTPQDDEDEGYSLWKWGLILVGLVLVMIFVLARWGGQ
jgi:hypothetical protein